MLALLGLLGALMAGVVADFTLARGQTADGEDDETGTEPDTADDGGTDGADSAPGGSILDFAQTEPSLPGRDLPEPGFDSSDTPPLPVPDQTLAGTPGIDILTGGAGDDTLSGDAGDDHLTAGAGADLVHGGAGKDAAQGDDGADTLFGGDGNDWLAGHMGDDLLSGDAGDDSLLGGAGADTLDGGAGDDWLAGGQGADVLRGGAGQDTLDGGDGNDTIWGADRDATEDDANFLNGGSGDDLLMIGGGDHATGGAGADVFSLSDWIAEARPATIADFDAIQDEIVVVYDAAAHPDPQLTVQADPDTGAATLMLDGLPLAVVLDGAGLEPAHVRLVSSVQLAA